MTVQLEELLQPTVELARRAGLAILEIYESNFEVETKADHSPLTAADRAAHELIVAGLKELTPALPILSEESAAVPFSERSQWGDFWLVDPLDGTKEFIKRNGEFTVNIALIREHRPVLGVVHVPARDVDYYGHRGAGAWLREPGREARRIEVRRPAEDPVRVVGSRSHRGASLEHFLQRMGPHEMVPMGSSLKICLIASGEADIYPRLGPTSEWDTAAAQAVLECAGGVMLGLDGEAMRYNCRETVLNPYFLAYGDPQRDWLGLATG